VAKFWPRVQHRWHGAGRSVGASIETRRVAAAPDGLTLDRNRDLRHMEKHPWTRRVLIALLSIFLLLGIANVFGQRPANDVGAVPGAELEVYSPTRVRSGLYFMSRFTIAAEQEIENATLVLDPGWLEGMTLNTLEPSPISEANRDGRLVLELGRVPAGTEHVFFLHFQVNPTNVGHRSQDVDLMDGDRLLVHLDRTMTIFP
jgi:hypothetical protein